MMHVNRSKCPIRPSALLFCSDLVVVFMFVFVFVFACCRDECQKTASSAKMYVLRLLRIVLFCFGSIATALGPFHFTFPGSHPLTDCLRNVPQDF